MYNYPYGDNQQINLNWIISEIIALHQRLDPDYTAPTFTQIYPFSDTQQLNLDWILTELKALKELAPTPSPTDAIDEVGQALIAGAYDADTSYQKNDYIVQDGKVYRANAATTGTFDPTKWREVMLGDDLAIITRWADATNTYLNNLAASNVANDSTVAGDTVKDALGNLNSVINSLKNVVTISELADLSLTENHFILFLANVNVGEITIPRYSRGVIVSSASSDATLYAIDASGNLYVSYRNSGIWTNTKNITGDIAALNTKTTERIIYQDNNAYTDNIGVDLNLTETVEGHSFLKVTAFRNAIASNSRVVLLYPIGASACYLPALVDANYNYVRCEAHNNIFSIVSTSYSSLYVRSISLIL